MKTAILSPEMKAVALALREFHRSTAYMRHLRHQPYDRDACWQTWKAYTALLPDLPHPEFNG